MDDWLKDYIKEKLENGFSADKIKSNLLAVGRSDDEIENALSQLNVIRPPSYKIRKRRTQGLGGVINDQQSKSSADHDQNETPATSKLKLPKRNIIIFGIAVTGLIIAIIPKLNLFDSTGVKKSVAVSPKIHKTYLPIWKQLFMQENDVDEIFFEEHMFPVKTDLEKKSDSGEKFLIEYEYKVDWATVANQDGIIVKPKDEDDYLSQEELMYREASGTDVYHNDPIIKVESVISKKKAEEIVSTCRSNMEPASKPFKIAPFTSFGSDEKRLLYKAVLVVSNNQLVIAEVDLATGEMNCYDADIHHY